MIIIRTLEYLTAFFQHFFPNFQTPDFDYQSAISAISSTLRFVAWVLPMDMIYTIFGVSIIFILFRCVVGLWKLLPLT